MEIGAYSFGDTPRGLDGSLGSTAEATANLFEAIVHADEAGLDYFGVGEHHLPQLPVSSPGTLVAAAAAATSRIILSSSVSVLSTDDPVRIYQQFATTDAIAPGRVEIVAGRGSTGESFPLFGYAVADYDRLYAEKFELLLAINASSDGQVNWSGTVRTPLTGAPSLCRWFQMDCRCTRGAASSPPGSLDTFDVRCEICGIWWLPGMCGPSTGLSACERRSVSEPAATFRHPIRVPPH